MGKRGRSFLRWIQSPAMGKYAGRVTLGIFSLMTLTIATFVRIGVVNAGATNGVELNEDGVNEVRMVSVDYVFTFDVSVDAELEAAVRDYVYSSIDSKKLLYMVNMRQHVIFTTEEEMRLSNDKKTVCVPISSSSDQLWEALEMLE